MPTRAISINDELYLDIHKEMEKTNNTFSSVVSRRLEKLMLQEGRTKNA